MKKLTLVLIAVCLVAAGCDTKQKRTGSITLAGASNIPLNDRSGSHAELVAGPAEFTFDLGSKQGAVVVLVRQSNRADVTIEAPASGDYRSGNFSLRGADIGQPVDLVSSRLYAVTGPNQRTTYWEDQGFDRCMVDYSWDPCDEDWVISFRAAGGELGAFAARTPSRCNERRSVYACHPIPGREPRIPDYPRHDPRFPRDPREPRYPRHLDKVLSIDPATLKFD